MNKISTFKEFQKPQTFWQRTSFFKSSVREMLFFFLFPFVAVALFQTLSGNYFPFHAFAKSSAEQIVPAENHRLENFLISTKGRDDWTRLMLAILNSVSAVENVLSEGVSVNIRGTEEFHGVTPLMFASGIGAQTIVKLLIENGARLNDTDTLGKTALIQSAYKGHSDTVSFLLQQGANPNAETNQKWTALMYAAERGRLQILKTLLKHGARVDFQNNLGMSPMMYAAQKGHFKIVQFLLLRGIKLDITSLNGSSALIWAIRSKHENIAKLLLEAGAKTDILENEFQRSPLLLASMYGLESTVQKLLSLGADLTKVDKQGENALLLALSNKHFKTASLLIKSGISTNTQDLKKRTPIMEASAQGSLELTRLLIKKGVDVNARDFVGKTSLMIAAAEGHINIAKVLLREQSRLDYRDRYGWTAWIYAAEKQQLPMVKFLSEKEIDNEGNLFYAVSRGHLKVIKLLLDLGINIEIYDSQGWTLVMWAANNGHSKVV